MLSLNLERLMLKEKKKNDDAAARNSFFALVYNKDFDPEGCFNVFVIC